MRRSIKKYSRIIHPRQQFYDLSYLSRRRRVPHSNVVQFYSSVNNIGNYLPVMGIRKMLRHDPDTWCAGDPEIDFDFINDHYGCAIIGGAGLLHSCFESFWRQLRDHCRIPTIIWGIGVCFPDDSRSAQGVSRDVVAAVADNCELINVRDDITADHYGMERADISPCPTIAYLDDFVPSDRRTTGSFLVSEHQHLVSSDECRQIRRELSANGVSHRVTHNAQTLTLNIDAIIKQYYCPSPGVISTRLHGAIIAYGLGIPYLAVTRDDKLRAFHRLFGNGLATEEIGDVARLTHQLPEMNLQPRQLPSVHRFGETARRWIAQPFHRGVSPIPGGQLQEVA